METKGSRGVRIAGTGSYLPGPPLDQDAVRALMRRHADGLSRDQQEQILRGTGIVTRHFGIDLGDQAACESNASMAAEAGRRALAAAGWKPNDVDLLVVTTVVPDYLMPPTSTFVQERLGIERCAEIEISANCTASYKGLMVAASELRLGHHRRALVCSAQYIGFLTRPPWMNPSNVGKHEGHLRWIVSDGAGAIALACGEPDTGLRVWLDSSRPDSPPGMWMPFGAANPDLLGAFARGEQHVRQDMRAVLKVSLDLVVDGLERMLGELNICGESIAHFLPAVSSVSVAERFQKLIASRCGVPPEVWRMNFTRVGYLGAASLPVLLDELIRAAKVKPGDLVCATAEESSRWMLAGCVFRWNP